jgi:type IV pilus assembly protein PilE
MATFMTNHSRRARGFTLLELMITVTIAAILTLIAVSSYQTSITTSRRTDAKTALNDIAGREQRYFSVSNAYTANPALLGYSTTSSSTFPANFAVGNGYYYLTVTGTGGGAINAATATTPAYFIATATATGTQATKDTACETFTLDSTGTYGSTGTGTASPPCWP